MLPGKVLTLSSIYKLYLNKITQKLKARFSSSCIDREKSPDPTGTSFLIRELKSRQNSNSQHCKQPSRWILEYCFISEKLGLKAELKKKKTKYLASRLVFLQSFTIFG